MATMTRGRFEGLRTRLVRSARGTVLEVGAGVSGTLKSFDTRRMLWPFSYKWDTVPVFAFSPANPPDMCGP